ncbi:hypothetical protein ACFPN7_49100 [Amycolatopsis halotolerans]|uniref:hypothetical protein n=1 Tax=Amycolatopsis halotolerans TaxID=330083 RepID=UPI00361C38A2
MSMSSLSPGSAAASAIRNPPSVRRSDAFSGRSGIASRNGSACQALTSHCRLQLHQRGRRRLLCPQWTAAGPLWSGGCPGDQREQHDDLGFAYCL